MAPENKSVQEKTNSHTIYNILNRQHILLCVAKDSISAIVLQS